MMLLGLHVRPVAVADASNVAAIHVRSSRQVYTGILPAQFLGAMTVEERARSSTATGTTM
jgi:hypothetical protein